MKSGNNPSQQSMVLTEANMFTLKNPCVFILAMCLSWITIAAENYRATSKTVPFEFMNVRVKAGSRLTKGLLVKKTGSSGSSCLMSCMDHPQCVSFNLLKNGTCQLSSSDIYRDQDALADDENSQYFYMSVSSIMKARLSALIRPISVHHNIISS